MEACQLSKSYRPFANAAEFTPFRDRWITNRDGVTKRIESYNDFGVDGISYESLFCHRKFEDGTPVGVEVKDDEYTF